jgi:23S rRNA pseudouridine2605 synthase
MEERLQKILARAGYGSRRANEELIQAGRVKVNGVKATLGMKADISRDTITVDTNTIPKTEPERIYIALHKPRGVLSDVDPNDDRLNIRDLVPVPGHLFAVGRLDYDSEGLILLTNDGELANRLTHPRYGHEKEYRVLVPQRPDEEQLVIWRRGVVLEDGYRTAPAQVSVESTAARGIWLRVILREGRKRQIREVGSRIGLPVIRIVRVRIGSLGIGSLKPKEWRNLTMEEVKKLREISSAPAKVMVRPRPMARMRPGTSRTRPAGRQARPGEGARGGPSDRRRERPGGEGRDASTRSEFRRPDERRERPGGEGRDAGARSEFRRPEERRERPDGEGRAPDIRSRPGRPDERRQRPGGAGRDAEIRSRFGPADERRERPAEEGKEQRQRTRQPMSGASAQEPETGQLPGANLMTAHRAEHDHPAGQVVSARPPGEHVRAAENHLPGQSDRAGSDGSGGKIRLDNIFCG